ncbi:MAG: class I SAM-dependent methyltransferase [Sphingomonadaceae bacterium]|nr:class I SAM-dependent methyltransferase [Sphingomonadaceae bacterium]
MERATSTGGGGAASGAERDSGYYDARYAGDGAHADPAIYRAVYRAVVRRAVASGAHTVLEVGCGAGALGEQLARGGLDWRGFDFAPAAAAAANRRPALKGRAFVADARDAAVYAPAPDLIVCAEVLEHITDDLAVIERWPRATRVLATVPNFDAESHVRLFRTVDEVRERYGMLIDIAAVHRVARPIFAGFTPREWLQQLVWKRGDWRRLLGHVGINRFDWGYGWFVIEGRRS